MRKVAMICLCAAAAPASVSAASPPVVPLHSQQMIKQRTNLYAFVPTRVGAGFRYYRWAFQPGAQPALRIWFRHESNPSWVIVFVASPQRGPCEAGKEKSFQLDGNKVYWSHTADEQQAWRCVPSPVTLKPIRLTAATPLPPTRWADSGLGRIVASGRWVR
jgi:hypothetical protein